MEIPVSCVLTVKWNEDLGKKLRQMRSRSQMTLRGLARRTKNSCSHQHIKKLEDGKSKSVSVEMLENICLAMGEEWTNLMR